MTEPRTAAGRALSLAEERFWSKVEWNPFADEETRCWDWTSAISNGGYGQFYLEGRSQSAHRVAYEWEFGPIPDGLELDHLCRNRRCVRPSHLEAVTRRENILRGTSPSADHAKVTHCPRGHEFTPKNTYRRGTRRECRTCRQAARERRWQSIEEARHEARAAALDGLPQGIQDWLKARGITFSLPPDSQFYPNAAAIIRAAIDALP